MIKKSILGLGFFCFVMVLTHLTLVDSTQAQVVKATAQDLQKSVTYTFGGVTGVETITGITAGSGGVTTTVGVNGSAKNANNNTSFRIGSQSKMFTAGIMLEVMTKNGLTLDTTIADLMANSKVAAKLPAGIIERAGGLTLRQLLNMGTDIPNYLGEVPNGQNKSLFELWQTSTTGGATNGYGPVPGFSDSASHADLADLALKGRPTPPPGGLFSGIYSNSNAIILALIAEGLTGRNFDALMTDWCQANGFNNTYLQTAQGNANMIGSFNGQKIENLDPTIPWVSGAVITTMQDLLKSLEVSNSDPARTAAGNTTVINMHGMPTIYGLGLMSLDFGFISNLLQAPVALSPVVSTGHGGAIAGSGSFSGWLTSTDGTGLDVGLAVYANVTNAFSKGGIYTETPAETTFITMAEHLYRLQRANGTYGEDTTGGVKKVAISYGTTGGFSTTDLPGQIDSLSFTKAADQKVPLIAYFDWDSLMPQNLAINLDPVFTHYSTKTDTDATVQTNETVFNVTGAVDLPFWARMEGYSGDKAHAASSYTLLDLSNDATTDNLQGQVAVYGSKATAVRANRQVNLGLTSLIEAHGYNSTALELLSGTNNNIQGKVLGAGAKIMAVSVGTGTTATVEKTAVIEAHSYGSAMVDFNGPPVDRLENGATGIKLNDNSQAIVKGQVTASSVKTPDNIPSAISVGLDVGNSAKAIVDGGRVVSNGYAAHLTGNNSDLSLTNGAYLSGDLHSILVKNTATVANLNLANGSTVMGQIKVSDSSRTNANLTADQTSVLLAKNYSQPVIDGVKNVNLNGTIVTWQTTDLPQLGQAINVVNDYDTTTSNLNYRPNIGGLGTLAYTRDQGQIMVTGLAAGAYRSPNALGVYDAWQQASQGQGYGTLFIGDADNLTHESFATLGGAAMGTHRQNTGLARRALFPNETAGSVYTAPTYMSEKPSGSDTGSATMAALYDSQSTASILDSWSPINPENRSILAAEASLDPLATPAAGDGGSIVPRFIFDYVHTRSSRDDNGYSGYDHDQNGLLLGAALDINANFSLAGYFGWSKGETDFNYLRSKANTETAFAGLMGRWQQPVNDRLTARLTGHFSLSQADNDLERTVMSQGWLSSRLTGSFKQTVTGLGLEAALDWTPFGQADTRISPWLALDYAHLRQNDLREQAADLAPTAMWADGFKNDAFYTTMGVALAHDFKLSDAHILTVKGSAAWEHQFGDKNFSTNGGFIAGGPSFQARSLAMAQDAAVLGLTADVLHRLNNGDLFGLTAGIETRLMSGGHDQQYNLGLEYRF